MRLYTTEQVLDLLPVIVTAKELEDAVAQRKRELKTAARNGSRAGNGNGRGNGETPAPIAIAEAPVEVEDVEVVDATLPTTATDTETGVITSVSDTPEVRVPLRRLAASVGCSIVQLDEETISVFDCGPYALIDDTSGDRVWPCGLPLAGILDALHRLAHERHLPADRKGEAWIGFGK